jgi:hypothetical protein
MHSTKHVACQFDIRDQGASKRAGTDITAESATLNKSEGLGWNGSVADAFFLKFDSALKRCKELRVFSAFYQTLTKLTIIGAILCSLHISCAICYHQRPDNRGA